MFLRNTERYKRELEKEATAKKLAKSLSDSQARVNQIQQNFATRPTAKQAWQASRQSQGQEKPKFSF